MTHSIDYGAVTQLKGVGAKTAEYLAQLGLHTFTDLLFHLPLRYENRTKITPIAQVRHGDVVLIEGSVVPGGVSQTAKRHLLCQIDDGTASVTLRFFRHYPTQKKNLEKQGLTLRCFGEIKGGYASGLEMMHPEYVPIQKADELPIKHHLSPIYPVTQGLHQKTLCKLVNQVLLLLDDDEAFPELLPQTIREAYQWMDIVSALKIVHHPPPNENLDLLLSGQHPAQERLAFEELLAHHLCLQKKRSEMRKAAAYPLSNNALLQEKLLKALPFSLTAAQQRVLEDIQLDLKKPVAMLRLLQGDVGSGKTIVAALSVLQTVASGCQAAVMAPTEILAEQHYYNFKEWLQPLGIRINFLSSKAKIIEENAQLTIGTHALFQEAVSFDRLALLVIDEQHRFGVRQRLALKEKGEKNGYVPHQLVMSATPIPRTLAMTAYADLDCSVIDELPPGREPIQTLILSNQKRDLIVQRIHANCQKRHQVYWVCTLIDESEVLQCEAAEKTVLYLQKQLPELTIALVHGRMKYSEKEAVMASFKQGDIHVLVATTVIEVGVDVPNANLMVIENPERLGLAQLHQLRGRVGRGCVASFCVLLYQAPLSELAKQRLSILRDTQDGFRIAQEDLAIRGPGDVLGTRQSGLMDFKVADLLRDKKFLDQVHAVGQTILKEYPACVEPIIQRWIKGAPRSEG